MAGRYLSVTIALATLGFGASALHAQSDERDPSIANLPRPGYEPRTIRAGSFVIEPTLEADATYDDNILATPTDKDSDAIFSLRPRVTAERKGPTLQLKGDIHADILRYADHSRENVNTFGAALDATKTLSTDQAISANLAFDRTFERRSDPEADVDRTRPPALINMASGELRYQYQGPRVGIIADATVAQINYLPTADADRDLLTYRGSVRGSLKLTKRIALFVEPFVNRRDARLAVDRTGVNRDTTTMGALAGVSFDLGDTLTGSVGLGAFRANPDDPSLRSFTGLAASGRLVWRPRLRTAVVFDVFRGDVATIRAGAIGRIDTRIGLAVDQEVRHNLILHGSAGMRDIHYRGVARNQRYLIGTLEARYLLDRHISLVAGTAYTHRTATIADERFNRWQATLGVRLTY